MKMPDNWPTGAMCNAFTVEAGTEVHIGNFAMGLKAALAAAPTPEVEPELGGCGNGECNWHGPIAECRMLGTIGPLCPDCGDTVEPDIGVPPVPQPVPTPATPSDELRKAAEALRDFVKLDVRWNHERDRLLANLEAVLNKVKQ